MAKGGDPVVTRADHGFEIGRGYHLREAGEGVFGPVLLVATGVATTRVLAAAERLEEAGICCDVLHLPTVKPLDEALLVRLTKRARLVVTVEEGTLIGGLSSAVTDVIVEHMNGKIPPLRRLGVPDVFLHDYGSQDSLMEACGLQPDQIASTVQEAVGVLAAA